MLPWQTTVRYNSQPTAIIGICPNYSAVELETYVNILCAFVSIEPNWVRQWFASEEEQAKLEEQKSLSEDEVYMLRYNQDDGMRHPIAVSPYWLRTDYLSEEDKGFSPIEGLGPVPWSIFPIPWSVFLVEMLLTNDSGGRGACCKEPTMELKAPLIC